MFCVVGLISALALLGAALGTATTTADSVDGENAPIFSLNTTQVGAYYDTRNTGKCGFDKSTDKEYNAAVPACEYELHGNSPSYAQLNTTRIASIYGNWVENDEFLSAYCGKEQVMLLVIEKNCTDRSRVQIRLKNGTIFKFEDGPLVLWDGCNSQDGSICDSTVPLQVSAMTGLNSTECAPEHIASFELLNTQVWEPVRNGEWIGPINLSASAAASARE